MLTDGAGKPAATSNLLVLGVLAIARFAVSDRVIWALRPDRDVPTQARSTEVGA
jgi:hypothetical protein